MTILNKRKHSWRETIKKLILTFLCPFFLSFVISKLLLWNNFKRREKFRLILHFLRNIQKYSEISTNTSFLKGGHFSLIYYIFCKFKNIMINLFKTFSILTPFNRILISNQLHDVKDFTTSCHYLFKKAIHGSKILILLPNYNLKSDLTNLTVKTKYLI